MPRLHAFTLVSALLIGLSLFTTGAAANISPVHLARHSEHVRMIKRYNVDVVERGLGDILSPPGAGDDDDDVDADDADGTSTATSIGSTSTGSQSTTRGGIDLGDIIGGEQTTTPSSTSTPTPTPAPTRTRSTTTEVDIQTTASRASSATARPTITVTSWEDATPEEKQQIQENRDHQSSLSRIPENVRTILIVVASVVVGLAIIWTAIRKWKLRSSRSFQSRLAPIEWEDKPTTAPAMADTSDKDSIRRNMFAPDHTSGSLAPPAHDFTAGNAGGYPYTRTPSPAPFRTASPAPYRTASPAPGGLQRYPSNGSGGYEPHRGY